MYVLDMTEAAALPWLHSLEVSHPYLCGVSPPQSQQHWEHIYDSQSFLSPPWQINLEFLFKVSLTQKYK